MREIKFRGKRVDNGEWVCGYLFNPNAPLCDSNFGTWIMQEDFFDVLTGLKGSLASVKVRAYEVGPSTVGQHTGLKDKNGKEIWEGDVCRAIANTRVPLDPFAVIWNNEYAQWFWKDIKGEDEFWKSIAERSEVIGNIHDNPELLGEQL